MCFWVDSTSLNFRRNPAVKKWKVKTPPGPRPRPRPIQQVNYFLFCAWGSSRFYFYFVLFCFVLVGAGSRYSLVWLIEGVSALLPFCEIKLNQWACAFFFLIFINKTKKNTMWWAAQASFTTFCIGWTGFCRLGFFGNPGTYSTVSRGTGCWLLFLYASLRFLSSHNAIPSLRGNT